MWKKIYQQLDIQFLCFSTFLFSSCCQDKTQSPHQAMLPTQNYSGPRVTSLQCHYHGVILTGLKFQGRNELQQSFSWLDHFQSVPNCEKRNVTKHTPKTELWCCHPNVLGCGQRSGLRQISSQSRAAGSGPYRSGLSYY